MKASKGLGEFISLLGVAVVLAIALYYYYGTSTIIGSLGQAGSNLVTGYSNLLKPTYPKVG